MCFVSNKKDKEKIVFPLSVECAYKFKNLYSFGTLLHYVGDKSWTNESIL